MSYNLNVTANLILAAVKLHNNFIDKYEVSLDVMCNGEEHEEVRNPFLFCCYNTLARTSKECLKRFATKSFS